jgi:hypothetical protein
MYYYGSKADKTGKAALKSKKPTTIPGEMMSAFLK